jgi:integrase
MRELGRLTAAKVAAVKEPGRYADGYGLYLAISKWRTKSWLLRYQIAGRCREMGLGSLADVSLMEARKAAQKARRLLIDGVDPIDERSARKEAIRAERAKHLPFKDAAEQYISRHQTTWKNAKHKQQWRNTLATYAYPVIGQIGVGAIETHHIVAILEPIWITKPDTANRVRGRIEAVLDWASAMKRRTGENPARKKPLKHLLPDGTKARTPRHHKALPYANMPAFMAELRAMDSISARALEFTILTSARTGATTGAVWSEIDEQAAIWTVPGSRAGTKLRQAAHVVPLPQRAMEILRSLPREKGNDHIFVGAKKGKGLSNMAMLELLQGRYPDLTVHGFRATFKTWASETTNFDEIVSEMALAHVVSDQVIAAYRRGNLILKRRDLMEAWSRYCASPAKDSDNVTPMVRQVA